MNTPSKELITEVLEIEKPDNITLIVGNKYNNNIKQTLLIEYNDESEPIMFNIYEFAFKCKEWALKQGYEIQSAPCDGINILKKDTTNILKQFDFYINGENKELLGIFKACEYILLQIKDNK